MGEGWADRPCLSPLPRSILSHPEGTLWTDGAPHPKGPQLCPLATQAQGSSRSCCHRGLLLGLKVMMAMLALVTAVISSTINTTMHLWSIHHARDWAGSIHYLNHL